MRRTRPSRNTHFFARVVVVRTHIILVRRPKQDRTLDIARERCAGAHDVGQLICSEQNVERIVLSVRAD